MRISELSRTSGVPVATIKYYLREGLLHEGVRTSATQARYDASHVARLGLVRALLGVGGLSIAATKDVLAQLDHPPASMHDLLGSVTHRLIPDVSEDLDLAGARALIDELGWRCEPDHEEQLRPLAAALAGMRSAGFELSEHELINYARAMHEIAADEVARVPTDSHEAAVRYVTLGIVLVEPLLLALRRLAQADVSASRFDRVSPPLRPADHSSE